MPPDDAASAPDEISPEALEGMLDEVKKNMAAAGEIKRVKPEPRKNQGRVLVVDDSRTILMAVKMTLEKAGFDVDLTQNGTEALVHARRRRPDLILLDVNMPGMDGFDFCTQYRVQEKEKEEQEGKEERKTPIVFLTTEANRESIYRAMQAGGTDYLAKPFKPDALLAKVEKSLERAKK